MTQCLECGTPIPRRESGSGLQKKYCSAKCRGNFWRKNNHERDRSQKRKYWRAHREKHNARSLARYYENRGKLLAYQKVHYQKTRLTIPWRVSFNSAKTRSNALGLPFDLTHEWAISRWTGRCELTNIHFILGTPRGQPRTFAPSIDRIKPSLGYIQSNCRFVLHSINAFKGDDSDENMLLIARSLISNAE